MRLLFDQNISFRIVKKIQLAFPGSKQVGQVGLNQASDGVIWEYAKQNNFSIVTFDSDFYDFSLINNSPPKIIWLRTGNFSTNNIAEVLLREADNIKYVLQETDGEARHCLEIY